MSLLRAKILMSTENRKKRFFENRNLFFLFLMPISDGKQSHEKSNAEPVKVSLEAVNAHHKAVNTHREPVYSNRKRVNADRERVNAHRKGVRTHRECVLRLMNTAFSVNLFEAVIFDYKRELRKSLILFIQDFSRPTRLSRSLNRGSE